MAAVYMWPKWMQNGDVLNTARTLSKANTLKSWLHLKENAQKPNRNFEIFHLKVNLNAIKFTNMLI